MSAPARPGGGASRRDVAVMVALAATVRVLVALRTAVPERDAASYLWMAEQLAAGRVCAAFESDFHPGLPLLIAPLLALFPRLDPVAAGQTVSAGLATVAVVPLMALARRLFGPAAARAAGLLYAVGVWFARHPADVMSEGPFFLVVAGSVAALVRRRRRVAGAALAGVVAGLGHGLRPEAAALLLAAVPWLLLRRERRAAVMLACGFAVAASPWVLGWWWCGHGLTPTPKLMFNWEVGVGHPESGGLEHYLLHLAKVPLALCEGVGFVAAPAGVWGVWRARRLGARHPAALPVAALALQLAVIPYLRSHYRFVAGYGILLLPFAGLAWRGLRPRLAAWPRPAVAALVLVAVAGDLVRIPQARREDRRVLVGVGRWLRPRLGGPGELVTPMPRLEYYAGVRPGPARPRPREEILALAARPAARWVVVVAARTGIDGRDLSDLGYGPAPVPPGLREAVAERGLLVYHREPR